MAFYRIYYGDRRGKIFSADDFQARDDGAAVERATLLAGASGTYEVWQRDRLVHRHPDNAAIEGDRPDHLGQVQMT